MLGPNNMLRFALAIEFLLIGVYLAIPSVLDLKLPTDLQTYLDRGEQSGWAPTSPVNSFVSMPLVVVHLFSAAGLWFFRRWARLPYGVSSIWAFLGALFGGPPVQHVFEYVLEEAWIFTSGVVTALIYYASIKWSAAQKV